MTHSAPRILIVEDDKANCLLFEMTLQKRGHFRTIATEDVDDVLSLARNREIDLVLLDVSLANSKYRGEKVDGIAIARMLKSDPTTRQIPILISTAHNDPGDREKIPRASGADDFIGKPIVDGCALVRRINTLLLNAVVRLPQLG